VRDEDRRLRPGDRLSAPHAADAAVTLSAVIGGGRAASGVHVQAKERTAAAETRTTTPKGADDPTLLLKRGEGFHDTIRGEPRTIGDAVGTQSLCPDDARDGVATRRLVTRIGHGLSRADGTSTRAEAPVGDVAYARSSRNAMSDTERPCVWRRSGSVDVIQASA
jgi:hypothetical protein